LSNPPGVKLEDDEGKGLPDEYGDYVIMKEMGWDYWTYISQPETVIYMVSSFISAEMEARYKLRKNKDVYR
jgi:hypothetical protein